MNKENTIETHESFGMLNFSRVSSGKPTHLFGSSIPHNETIRLKISPGMVERNLHSDWYMAGNGHPFIEVEMSHSQFSESITSMNMGSGIPVTIRRINGKGVAEQEFVNKRIQFEEEFSSTLKDMKNKMNELVINAEEILTNKKSITKGDKEVILNEITSLKSSLSSTLPFIFSLFNEQMDKTVMESKAEVEAFTTGKINSLGLEKLEDLKKIISYNAQHALETKEEN